jgi:hypothetical protein
MLGLAYILLETKSIVAQLSIAGCWIPNKNKNRPARKSGFKKIYISLLGLQYGYHYFPENTICGVLLGEMGVYKLLKFNQNRKVI